MTELLKFKLASSFAKLRLYSISKVLYKNLLNSPYEMVVRKSANNLAIILDEEKKYNESIELLENILEKKRTIDLIYSLSVSYRNINDVRKEIELLKEVISSNEKDDVNFFYSVLNLIEIYRDKKNLKNAIELCKKYESLFSNKSKFLYNYGVVLLDMEKYGEAIERFKKALDLDEHNVHIVSNLALAYSMINNFDNAIKYYNQALKVANSKEEKAHEYFGLASCYYETNKKDDAVKLFRRASKYGYEKAKQKLLEIQQEEENR